MASAYMFSHYWPGDGVQGELPPAATGWQGLPPSLIAGTTLLWLLSVWPDAVVVMAAVPAFPWPLSALWARLTWWAARQLWRRLSLRYRLLWTLWRLLGSDAFLKAQEIVSTVATTPGMRDRSTWGEIGRWAGAYPGLGENVYRHLRAAALWEGAPRFGRLHERNLLLELAYFSLKDSLRGELVHRD